MIIKKSVEHLNENQMTYWQHFWFACNHGLRCIKAGLLLICHSIIPAFFAKTGSELVNRLNQSFVTHNEYLIGTKEKNNHVE
jgi:hypothetical protein